VNEIEVEETIPTSNSNIGKYCYPRDNSYHLNLNTGKQGDYSTRVPAGTGGWEILMSPLRCKIVSLPYEENLFSSYFNISKTYEFINVMDDQGTVWKVLNNLRMI